MIKNVNPTRECSSLNDLFSRFRESKTLDELRMDYEFTLKNDDGQIPVKPPLRDRYGIKQKDCSTPIFGVEGSLFGDEVDIFANDYAIVEKPICAETDLNQLVTEKLEPNPVKPGRWLEKQEPGGA